MLFDPVSGNPQAVEFDYLTPRWDFLDPELKADFESINRGAKGFVDLVSRDSADRNWIIALRRSDAPPTYYRFDRTTKKLTEFFAENPLSKNLSLRQRRRFSSKLATDWRW